MMNGSNLKIYLAVKVAQGWIVTANTDPYGFSDNGRYSDDPFYYGAFYAPGWRADRIQSELQRVSNEGPISSESMKALQMDTHSNLADDLLPLLEDARGTKPTEHPDLADLSRGPSIGILNGSTPQWVDRRMVRDSTEAATFHAFAHFLTEEVLSDDLPIIFSV